MIRPRILLLILIAAAAGSAWAILPPDASLREPEIRAHRQKVRENYEKRLKERQKRAIDAHERATKALNVPPWELDRVLDGKRKPDIQAAVEERILEGSSTKRRLLVSIVLFILLGAAVLWVKHATRSIDE